MTVHAGPPVRSLSAADMTSEPPCLLSLGLSATVACPSAHRSRLLARPSRPPGAQRQILHRLDAL